MAAAAAPAHSHLKPVLQPAVLPVAATKVLAHEGAFQFSHKNFELAPETGRLHEGGVKIMLSARPINDGSYSNKE